MGNQGNPVVRAGANDLIFGTSQVDPSSNTTTLTPRIDRYIASPFFHWDFRSWQLKGNVDDSAGLLTSFDLPAFSLANTPFVLYGAQTPFWTSISTNNFIGQPSSIDFWNQHEVILFTRDPVEMSGYFRNYAAFGFSVYNVDTSDESQVTQALAEIFTNNWRQEWHNCVPSAPLPTCAGPTTMPDAATMFYPPQKNWTTPVPTIANVTPVSFWGSAPPSGPPGNDPGAEPAPELVGSIKAAKVINHGICSKPLPYVVGDGSGLFEQLASVAPKAAANFLFSVDPSKSMVKRWLNVAPFLDFTTEQEDAQLGGFFLDVNLQFNNVCFFGACGGANVFYHDAHRWRLFDGRLTADGEVLYKFGTGTGGGTVELIFDDVLGRELDSTPKTSQIVPSLAGAIFQVANALQRYIGDFDPVPEETCDGSQELVTEGPGLACQQFIQNRRNDLKTAFAVLAGPLGLTKKQQDQVRDETLLAKDASGTLKNFRCAKFPGDANATCQYVLRAKRINVMPDAVELVFIDDPLDLSNPTYPMWLHVLERALSSAQGANGLTKLCGAPVAQSPGSLSTRSFNFVPTDYETYTCGAYVLNPDGKTYTCTSVVVSP